MQEQNKPPLTRSERLQRTLRVNTMLGIGNSSCHDIEITYPQADSEATLGEGYVVSVDLETGELATKPYISE